MAKTQRVWLVPPPRQKRVTSNTIREVADEASLGLIVDIFPTRRVDRPEAILSEEGDFVDAAHPREVGK